MRNWSALQQAIFQWFKTGTGNLVVRARAGCGKTTTILQGVTQARERRILIAAFSKIIQTEIEAKLFEMLGKQFRIKARTLHAIGLLCVHKFREGITVSFSGDRAEAITDAVCGITTPDVIKRLVTKLHTKGREIAPHACVLGDLTEIAIEFDCMPTEEWAESGYPLERVEQLALDAMEWAANVQNGTEIDGSDMIFLPVRNRWLIPMFDLVVVDEAQDMTVAQLEIAQGVLAPGGRMCIVGDDRQAIFGFRGADSGSLDRLKRELNAQELGLNVTYRCGQRIVEEAQALVPDFVCGEGTHMGEVLNMEDHEMFEAAGPGDFVLSRSNAPLVRTALKFLKAGKRTIIAGPVDIGRDLINLVRKQRARTVPEFVSKMEMWGAHEVTRLQGLLDALPAEAKKSKRNALLNKISDVEDRTSMMFYLAEEATTMQDVENRILNLFKDDGLGAAGRITCSSVHRAKGLEAKRVFMLAATFKGWSEEEQNINYVAVTRAKETLVYVQ